MARARVVHSTDAVTVIFEGDRSKPEPTTGIIKFPGGFVEVSRCTEGGYWCHLRREQDTEVEGEFEVRDSRIDYDHEGAQKHGVGSIPDEELAQGMALRIGRKT